MARRPWEPLACVKRRAWAISAGQSLARQRSRLRNSLRASRRDGAPRLRERSPLGATRKHAVVAHLVRFFRVTRNDRANRRLETAEMQPATARFLQEHAPARTEGGSKQPIAFVVLVALVEVGDGRHAARKQRVPFGGPHVAAGGAAIVSARKCHAVGLQNGEVSRRSRHRSASVHAPVARKPKTRSRCRRAFTSGLGRNRATKRVPDRGSRVSLQKSKKPESVARLGFRITAPRGRFRERRLTTSSPRASSPRCLPSWPSCPSSPSWRRRRRPGHPRPWQQSTKPGE